jgi:hypothetical protein
MPDRTLQEIVHKIFPWMKAREEEEERNFYAQRGIDLKPEYATQVEGTAHGRADKGGRSSEGGGDAATAAAVDVSFYSIIVLLLFLDDCEVSSLFLAPHRPPAPAIYSLYHPGNDVRPAGSSFRPRRSAPSFPPAFAAAS